MNDDHLRESLQELYEQAPCGYIFTRPDGLIVRVNQTFLAWTGYERDDLVSRRRFQDLLTVPGRIFYENQYAPLLRIQGSVKEVAFDLVRDGRPPLSVLVNSVNRTGADGQPLLIASTIFDATDRRRYEQELLLARRKAEHLAVVVTSASDAIVSASPDGTVQTWNAGARHLFAYEDDQIIGRSLLDLVTLPGGGREWHRILAELRAGRPVRLETVGQRANGETVDVSVVLTPHQGLLGELSLVSAIIRDISERRAIERLQQEFLAMASHELRNPLTAIRGHAQLMLRRGEYSSQSAEAIVAQANHLGRLIDDLLLASQIEADRLDLAMQEVDIVAEARAAVKSLHAGASTIRFVTAVDSLSVAGDRVRLAQVFANLLTNAIKYSPGGSDVVLRVARVADEAHVSVIDQGIGISPEDVPHLFSRFYRAAGAATRAQGLGLGLYITRRIVEAHGGTIDVQSQPGRGSTFTVRLPLRTDDPERSAPGESVPRAPATH